jgi:hypothetical protein
MMHRALASNAALGLGLVAAACASAVARDAAACGGCFHPPTQTVSNITDERMLLAVSSAQSTLYDQIQYSGSPASFAWVLPIHGTVDVGLSADVLFDSIDEMTATHIQPPEGCICRSAPGAIYQDAAPSGDASSAVGAVTITKQQNVGPYATVQLHSADSSALSTWLTNNGFDIPQAVTPVIAAYVAEGFDFLAMKLLPNQGVQAMRPVRVTTQGASLSLPLRMASVGTGVTVGITIWVVSDGRYEPTNFPFFHIDDSQLVWDFSQNISNYTTLEAQTEADAGNGTWEIQSSIDLNEQVISNTILSGGLYYGNYLTTVTPADPSIDYVPVGAPPSSDAGSDAAGADGGYESAEEVRAADIATLFTGLAGPTVRVTRIRSDIAHAAMTQDLVLGASADQSELSNVRFVRQSINLYCSAVSGCYGPDAALPATGYDAGTSHDASVGTPYDASVAIDGAAPGTPRDASAVSVDNALDASGAVDHGGAAPSAPPPNAGGSHGCSAAPTGAVPRTNVAALFGIGSALALVASRRARSRRRRGAAAR